MKKIFTILFSVILSTITLFAQPTSTSLWTWVKGSNTTNKPSIFGLQGIANGTNTPGSRNGLNSWTDKTGNLWLFGGNGNLDAEDTRAYLNHLWKYSIATNEWTWMKGSNVLNDGPAVYGTKGVPAAANTPSGRYRSVSWTDAVGNFWLYGGIGKSTDGSGTLSDLWRYDVAANVWTWMSGETTAEYGGHYTTLGVAAPENNPPAIASASGWVDKSGNLWLHDYNSQLWKYDISKKQWACMNNGSSLNPGLRQGTSGWTDAAGRFWLFGGFGLQTYNDLWRYDPAVDQWMRLGSSNVDGNYGTQGVASASTWPTARGNAVSIVDKQGAFWLFGGTGYGEVRGELGPLNDLWKYNPATGQWTWVKGDKVNWVQTVYGTKGVAAPTNKLGGRSGNAFWMDNQERFWFFGGTENDLWKLSDDIKFRFYQDADGDGYGNAAISTEAATPPEGYVGDNGDCNDNLAAINPGAEEVCSDNIDNNCNGLIDEGCIVGQPWYRDNDGDGYGDRSSFIYAETKPEGYSNNNYDCDDTDAATNLLALEICDGKDNDCDGLVDEDCTYNTYYRDADGDDFGNRGDTVHAGSAPSGYVSDSTDCDDTDATIYPGACDVYDGKDNNCNGQIDEGVVRLYRDRDYDGYGDATDAGFLENPCSPGADGYSTNNLDFNDHNEDAHPGAPETCDGVDNDGNGQIDDGVKLYSFYRDADNDGYVNTADSVQACSEEYAPGGYLRLAVYDDDGFKNIDCDDTNPAVHFGCSTITWYQDNDNDGYGNKNVFVTALTKPAGYVAKAGDCNDNDKMIHPGGPSICDGKDNDCDGFTDEKCAGAALWYKDADGDGYGNAAVSARSTVKPKGYVSNSTDCNDSDKDIHPNGPSLCDGKDNDCDGLVDENCGLQARAGATLQLTALPNPATHHFTLRIQSTSTAPVQVRIINEVGKMVDVRNGVAANATLHIGHNYISGIYYAEVIQDGKRVSLKLVKARP